MSSPFTSFLAQHFDQINDYLATFFDGQATSADIERYLYAPLSALRPTPASATARLSVCSPQPQWAVL
ncbi:MAG: hypothetical protein ACLTYW_05920 [Collinsella sp.]